MGRLVSIAGLHAFTGFALGLRDTWWHGGVGERDAFAGEKKFSSGWMVMD